MGMHRQLGEVGSPTLRKSEVAKCECVCTVLSVFFIAHLEPEEEEEKWERII